MPEMKKVWIEDGECISCEACVEAAPEVFEMGDSAAVVKDAAKDPGFVGQQSETIGQAIEACPVEAIKTE